MPRVVNHERLFYFWMPRCPVCALVKPVIAEFKAAMPTVEVLPVDITSVAWNANNWAPRVTPTLIRLPAQEPRRYIVYEGRPSSEGGQVIRPEEVRLWLQQNFSWK